MNNNVLFSLLIIGLAFNLICCASSHSSGVTKESVKESKSSAPPTIPIEINDD